MRNRKWSCGGVVTETAFDERCAHQSEDRRSERAFTKTDFRWCLRPENCRGVLYTGALAHADKSRMDCLQSSTQGRRRRLTTSGSPRRPSLEPALLPRVHNAKVVVCQSFVVRVPRLCQPCEVRRTADTAVAHNLSFMSRQSSRTSFKIPIGWLERSDPPDAANAGGSRWSTPATHRDP